MKERKLTKTQKMIYDSIKTKGWFTYEDLSVYIKNRNSHCQKIAEKGFFDTRFFPCGGNFHAGVLKYKKIIKVEI